MSFIGNFDNSMTIRCAQHVRHMRMNPEVVKNGFIHLGSTTLIPKYEGLHAKAEQDIKA